MNAIEVKYLNKSYKTFEISGVSFNIPTGSIVGLVGENGAGKSTLIKLIMNAILRDSGYIKVLGVENTTKEFVKLKQDIGVVLDEAYFPYTIDAKKLNIVMKSTFDNWNEKCYFDYVSKFRLDLKKNFKDYSRGMRMKLSIAVALSHNPKLLILDEATSGLDPIVRDEILDVFNDFTRDEENTILLSSHIVSDLEKICDYLMVINNGKLLVYEEKDKLIEKYGIIKLSHNNLADISPEAIVSTKEGRFSTEALVIKSMIPNGIVCEHSTLEDIILFLVRGEG